MEKVVQFIYRNAGTIMAFLIVGISGSIGIYMTYGIMTNKLPDLDSVTFAYEKNEEALKLLKKDIQDLKLRFREVEENIDEIVGSVFFSIAHSPIKEFKLPEDSAIVPPTR